MQTYRTSGLGDAIPASIAQSMGAPADVQGPPGTSAFVVARTRFGRTIYVPLDANGNGFGMAWDANWNLIPIANAAPAYPDAITQGVVGLPEGAQTGAPSAAPAATYPVPGLPGGVWSSQLPPPPAGSQYYWDNASQKYLLGTLGVTSEVQGIADAKAHAASSLADMAAEIATLQGSGTEAAAKAATALNFGGYETFFPQVASQIGPVITQGVSALTQLHAHAQALWTADANGCDAAQGTGAQDAAIATFTTDLTSLVQQFNTTRVTAEANRDDAAKAALYALGTAMPVASGGNGVPPSTNGGGGGGGSAPSGGGSPSAYVPPIPASGGGSPSAYVPPIPAGGSAAPASATSMAAGLPLIAGLAILGALLMRKPR